MHVILRSIGVLVLLLAGCSDPVPGVPIHKTTAPASQAAQAPPPAAPVKAFEAPPPKPDPEKVTVYRTKTGSKYHRAGCSYLRRSAIPIDLATAKGLYGPCSRCNPPM